MTGGIVFLLIILVIVIGMVLIAELYDRRAEKAHRKILRQGVRCKGKITEIRMKGPLESRGPYPWRIIVEFEYNDSKYRLEEQTVSKPIYSEGDSITVYVNPKDLNNSKLAI